MIRRVGLGELSVTEARPGHPRVRDPHQGAYKGAWLSMDEHRAKILARDQPASPAQSSISARRWAMGLTLGSVRYLLYLAAAMAVQTAQAADLPYAVDVERSAREAAAQGKVLVVLYGTATCPWCAKVRRNYLGPLAKNPDASKQMMITEIDMETALPLTDFRGRATDHRSFARAQGVRVFPTVMFYGRNGDPLAEPLIGMSSEDFYGAYLEERIAIATKRLSQGR